MPGQQANPAHITPEPMLSAKAVAQLLGVSERTLRRWDKSGLLVPRRLGATLRYRASDVDAFIGGEAPET